MDMGGAATQKLLSMDTTINGKIANDNSSHHAAHSSGGNHVKEDKAIALHSTSKRRGVNLNESEDVQTTSPANCMISSTTLHTASDPPSEVGDKKEDGPAVNASGEATQAQASNSLSHVDDLLCSVCYGGECEEGNHIVLCDGCDKGVHQACYGVKVIPEGKWFCSLCEHLNKANGASNEQSSTTGLVCKLCRHEGGIMRRGSERLWVHSSCVLFATCGPYFKNQTDLDEPYGIKQSLREAKFHNYSCQLCSYVGYPLACSYPNCNNRLHVSCAKKMGHYCGIQSVVAGAGSNRRGTVWKVVFCNEHTDASSVEHARQEVKKQLMSAPPNALNHYNITSSTSTTRRDGTTGGFRNDDGTDTDPAAAHVSAASASIDAAHSTYTANPISPTATFSSDGANRSLSFTPQLDDINEMDAGTASNTQIHAAPTRGIRVNWLRYENWFKKIAIGPCAEQLIESLLPSNRRASREEAKQIEDILTDSTPPNEENMRMPPISERKTFQDALLAYEELAKECSNAQPNGLDCRMSPIAIIDFGISAVFAPLKVKNQSVESFMREREVIDMLIEDLSGDEQVYHLLKKLNALPPPQSHNEGEKEGRREGNPVKSLSMRVYQNLSFYQMMYLRRKSLHMLQNYKEKQEDINCTSNQKEREMHASGESTMKRMHIDGSGVSNVKQNHAAGPLISMKSGPSPFLMLKRNMEKSNQRTEKGEGAKKAQIETGVVHVGGLAWPAPRAEILKGKYEKLVDAEDDFVGMQCGMFLSFAHSCYMDLTKMRSHLLDKVLEENSLPLRVSDRSDALQEMQTKYNAMTRWSHLCNSLQIGYMDREKKPIKEKSGTTGASANPGAKNEAAAATPADEEVLPVCCSVCFNDEGTNLNPVYTCCRCYMAVHKSCYGIMKAGDDSDVSEWICKRCEFEKKYLATQWQISFRSGSIICAVCGVVGGALKRMDGERWVHVLCGIWLIPEMKCENLEQLEVWNGSGLQEWRRKEKCQICEQDVGYCMKCSDERCRYTFHPMCAWLKGLYTKAVKYNHDFLEWNGKLDHCFPKLQVECYCVNHTPMEVKDRSLVYQMEYRLRRYVNRDIKPEVYNMKERRDKRQQFARGGRLSRGREPSFVPRQLHIEDESVCIEVGDQYLSNTCTVCLSGEAPEPDNPLMSCSKCAVSVHRYCYGVRPECFDKKGDANTVLQPFMCDVCLWGYDATSVYCKLCPRKGGALKYCSPLSTTHHSYGHQPMGHAPFSSTYKKVMFAHMTCCLWSPNVQIADNDEMHPIKGVELVPKLYRVCEVCSLSYGYCLECNQKGCNKCFHPLCGQLKGYFLEMWDDCVDGFTSMSFCEVHSKARCNISSSIRLFLKLRAFLELARILVDQLRKRERIKHLWLRKRKELLNKEYPLMDESLIKRLLEEGELSEYPSVMDVCSSVEKLLRMDKEQERKSMDKDNEQKGSSTSGELSLSCILDIEKLSKINKEIGEQLASSSLSDSALAVPPPPTAEEVASGRYENTSWNQSKRFLSLQHPGISSKHSSSTFPSQKSKLFKPYWAVNHEEARTLMQQMAQKGATTSSTLNNPVTSLLGKEPAGISSTNKVPTAVEDAPAPNRVLTAPSFAGSPSSFVPLGHASNSSVVLRNKRSDAFVATHLDDEELLKLVQKTCGRYPDSFKRGRGRPSRRMKICWLLQNGERAEAEQYARTSGRTFEEILMPVEISKGMKHDGYAGAYVERDDLSSYIGNGKNGVFEAQRGSTFRPLIGEAVGEKLAKSKAGGIQEANGASPVDEKYADAPISARSSKSGDFYDLARGDKCGRYSTYGHGSDRNELKKGVRWMHHDNHASTAHEMKLRKRTGKWKAKKYQSTNWNERSKRNELGGKDGSYYGSLNTAAANHHMYNAPSPSSSHLDSSASDPSSPHQASMEIQYGHSVDEMGNNNGYALLYDHAYKEHRAGVGGMMHSRKRVMNETAENDEESVDSQSMKYVKRNDGLRSFVSSFSSSSSSFPSSSSSSSSEPLHSSEMGHHSIDDVNVEDDGLHDDGINENLAATYHNYHNHRRFDGRYAQQRSEAPSRNPFAQRDVLGEFDSSKRPYSEREENLSMKGADIHYENAMKSAAVGWTHH